MKFHTASILVFVFGAIPSRRGFVIKANTDKSLLSKELATNGKANELLQEDNLAIDNSTKASHLKTEALSAEVKLAPKKHIRNKNHAHRANCGRHKKPVIDRTRLHVNLPVQQSKNHTVSSFPSPDVADTITPKYASMLLPSFPTTTSILIRSRQLEETNETVHFPTSFEPHLPNSRDIFKRMSKNETTHWISSLVFSGKNDYAARPELRYPYPVIGHVPQWPFETKVYCSPQFASNNGRSIQNSQVRGTLIIMYLFFSIKQPLNKVTGCYS